MTDQEFEREVRMMRRCQLEYEKSFGWTARRYKQDWERRVDMELKRREEAARPQQANLLK